MSYVKKLLIAAIVMLKGLRAILPFIITLLEIIVTLL